MGRAGRRKRDELAYETFDGAGCSSGLQLELAPGSDSGYAGVFPTTSSKWQATIRVEREGKKVRRNVGSFETKGEAAVQRALAIAGYIDVASPALRAMRSKGARFPHPWPCPNPFVTSPCYMCAGPDIEAVTSRAALGVRIPLLGPGAAKVLAAHTPTVMPKPFYC